MLLTAAAMCHLPLCGAATGKGIHAEVGHADGQLRLQLLATGRGSGRLGASPAPSGGELTLRYSAIRCSKRGLLPPCNNDNTGVGNTTTTTTTTITCQGACASARVHAKA